MATKPYQGQKGRYPAPKSAKRMARPEEVAYAVLFLASEGSEFSTGTIIDVNGASYFVIAFVLIVFRLLIRNSTFLLTSFLDSPSIFADLDLLHYSFVLSIPLKFIYQSLCRLPQSNYFHAL